MPETIEAEVIEIDGKPPPDRNPVPEPQVARGSWMLRLDRRWWPLWLLLGILGVAVGLVFGTLYLIFAVIRAFFRLIFGDSGGR